MTMLTDQEQAVLHTLIVAAERGEPCPTNETLARAAKARNGCRLVDKLRKAGVITVWGNGKYRVVRIEATGKHTAPEPRPAFRKPTRLDELAEHLANGLTMRDAAWQMAITMDHATRIFDLICARLGPQAV